jgi:hypothetical protein
MGVVGGHGEDSARISALEAELGEMRRQMAELRAQLRPATSESSESTDLIVPVGGGDEGRRPVSRRGLIAGAAGAMAAGAVAVVGNATPAAANGQDQSWTLGDQTNSATESTWLRSTANPVVLITNTGASTGNACQFYVHETGNTSAVTHHETAGLGPGIEIVASNASNTASALAVATGHKGSAGSFSVMNTANTATAVGVTTSGSGAALSAAANGGGSAAVLLAKGTQAGLFLTMTGSGNAAFINHTSTTSANPAVFVQTTSPSAAIRAKGPATNLNLWPRTAAGAPTADTVAHNGGDLVEDSVGNLWLCVSSGTPGQWRKLAGPATAGALHILAAPVRVYDSRPGTTPTVGSKTKLVKNVARTVDFTANNSTVPAGALAAMVNLLIVNAPAGSANFTLWKNGATRPTSNTMVWGGDAGRFSTLAVTALDSTGKAQVVSSVPTDVVIDVVGYYR